MSFATGAGRCGIVHLSDAGTGLGYYVWIQPGQEMSLLHISAKHSGTIHERVVDAGTHLDAYSGTPARSSRTLLSSNRRRGASDIEVSLTWRE
jgi:hypothetical protein